jgi:hypothetical protein
MLPLAQPVFRMLRVRCGRLAALIAALDLVAPVAAAEPILFWSGAMERSRALLPSAL